MIDIPSVQPAGPHFPRVPLALHVPLERIPFAGSYSAPSTPARKSTFYGASNSDDDAQSEPSSPALTPVQKLFADALRTDYDALCIPLANASWRDRWEGLCLKPEELEGGDGDPLDLASPTRSGFVIVPPQPNTLSPIRPSTANSYHVPPPPSPTPSHFPGASTTTPVEMAAELWRFAGGFNRGEVTITRLEEAEGVIGCASEWLDLDNDDEGIRFDSELVSRLI